MKLNERNRIIVGVLCVIEQMTFLVGTVWLVGWHSWSAWWFLITIVLIECSSPSRIIRALEKENE